MAKRQAGLPPPKERDVQRQCLGWLRLRGALVVRVNSGRRPWVDRTGRQRSFPLNDSPGCSDALVCLDGDFIALEFKRPGNRPTALQASFLAAVTRAGGRALVVDSLDALRAALQAEGYSFGD